MQTTLAHILFQRLGEKRAGKMMKFANAQEVKEGKSQQEREAKRASLNSE